jgi:Flp pilus assembly protein TadG
MKIGSENSKRGQRGATLVLFTMLVLLVVVPLVGLAIDGAVVFWAKAKLSAAVDAAALAAGRSINMQQSTAANRQPVINVANQWFAANFPSGWMGTIVQGGAPTVVPTQTSYSTQQVNVSATATVPLYFMRVAGFASVNISAAAQSSRRNTYVVLVLDRSGSMGSSGTNACPTMQSDSINFVNMFTENFDTLALVTYSTSAGPNTDFGPSQTFKSGMATAINSLHCTGGTNMGQALHMAYNSIKSNGLAAGLNVIVLFTDGQPNGLTADFPVRTQKDTRYGPGGSYPYNSLYSNFGPSGCVTSNNIITGGLVYLTNPDPPQVQGMTGGLYNTTTQVALSTSAGLLNTPGCYFTSQGNSWARFDVAYIPTTDSWGNKTNAGYGLNPPYYGPGISTTGVPDTFPSGPYAGKIRPDEQTTALIAASINSADYQAQVIRNDGTYSTVIFTIGLGGAADFPIDFTLLERMANDPRSPIFDSSKPQGYFAYAADPTQLNQAFTLVAGQILRLSQ